MTQEQKTMLVEISKSLVGKPYQYGSGPEKAPEIFDCSSFTQYVFQQIGIQIPRSSILQAADTNGQEIPVDTVVSKLEVGDLLFMRSDRGNYYDELFGNRKIQIGHVVLYIGNGEIIQARKKAGGVVIEALGTFVQEPNCETVFIKRF